MDFVENSKHQHDIVELFMRELYLFPAIGVIYREDNVNEFETLMHKMNTTK